MKCAGKPSAGLTVLDRFHATLNRVSRVVNAPFVAKAKEKAVSEDDGDYDESPPISPSQSILSRCDTRCVLITHDELAREFPENHISTRLIFDHPTIESIAHHLCDQDGKSQQVRDWAPAVSVGGVNGWARFGSERARPFTQLVMTSEDDYVEAGLGAKEDLEELYEEVGSSRYFRSTDGMECILLPQAKVWIGSHSLNSEALPMEMPCHQVELSSFLIDVEPVSIGAYTRFLNLAKPPLEALQDWILLHDIDERHCHLPLQCNTNHVWEAKPGIPLSWPMIMVSWYGANAYSLWANGCDWRNYRSAMSSFLPTEAQWEYAARGVNSTRFPWGDAPASAELLNVCFNMEAHDRTSHISTPLEEFPLVPVNVELGMSPFGLRHMAGNVLQWCRDTYDANFYASAAASLPDPCNYAEIAMGVPCKSERGGSWVEPAEVARSSYRRGRTAEGMGRCLGFRCIGRVADAHADDSEEESTTAASTSDVSSSM